MITINCSACGYIPRASGVPNTYNLNSSTDIYGINSSGTWFLGVIKFTTPISSTNSTWNQMRFNTVKLHLFNSTAQALPQKGKWTVGISGVLRETASNSNLPSNCANQQDFSPDSTARGHENIWDLTDLFNSIKNRSDYTTYSLQPNTNTWYLYIKPQSGVSSNSYFARRNQKIHFLEIDGTAYNPIKYYGTSGEWINCQAKYYDGENWIDVIPNYYDGSNWQQV